MTARFLIYLREWEHYAVNGFDLSNNGVRSAVAFQWPDLSFADRFSIQEFGRDPVTAAREDHANTTSSHQWEQEERLKQ